MPEITPAAPSAPVATTPESPAVATPAPAPEAVAKPPEQPKLGKAYAKLAQEQKAARLAGEKLKTERVAFEAQQNEYKAFQAAKAEAKRNPLKFLESLGISYQDVTESQLNEGQPTANLEVKALKDELEGFRKQQTEEKKQAVAAQEQQLHAQEQQVVEQFQKELTNTVKAAGEKFQLVNHFGHYQTVFGVINESMQQQLAAGTPPDQIRLLSVQEAAEAVEKYLEAEALKLTALPKFTAKAAVPPSANPAPKHQGQPTRSVTNQLTPTATAPQKRMTSAERDAWALERFHALRNK